MINKSDSMPVSFRTFLTVFGNIIPVLLGGNQYTMMNLIKYHMQNAL